MRMRIAAVCAVTLFCLAPVAVAQYGTQIAPEPKPNEGEAIAVGPFLFSPALELTWENRDNIFYAPDNEVADDIYVARALLMFELPIYDNYVRFSYRPQYREFGDYPFDEHWTHPLEVVGAFEFPSGLKLTPRYEYFSGALELREVDPGGELIVGGDRFTKHTFAIGADYWFNPRDGIRLDGDVIQLRYDEGEVNYDYDDVNLGIGWLHQVNPSLVMDVHYRHGDFDSKEGSSYRDQTSDEITVGFEGQVTETVSSGIRAGWRQTEPDLAPGESEIDDYSGPLVSGHLGYAMAHGGNLRLDLLYTDYPSTAINNAFYTAYGGNLTYELRRERLTAQARVRFQTNDYDQPDLATGLDRSDDIATLGVGASYRITDVISLTGGYLYEDRDTLYDYSYTSNAFVLGLVVGFGY